MIPFVFLLLILSILSFSIASIIIAAKSSCGGVVVAADSARVSSQPMISQRQVQKAFRLDDTTLICCISGENDFHGLYNDLQIQHQYRKASKHIDSYCTATTDPVIDVDVIAHYCRLLTNKRFRKSHMLIVGRNRLDKSFKIYEIFPQGTLIEHVRFAVSGQGSECVAGLLNEYFEHGDEGSKTSASNDEGILESLNKVSKAVAQALRLDHRCRGRPDIIVMK